MIREFGINIHTLLYLKWITNKEQVQHRELCSMVHGSLDGRGVWGEWMTCTYKAESLHCAPKTITTLLIDYSPKSNKKF